MKQNKLPQQLIVTILVLFCILFCPSIARGVEEVEDPTPPPAPVISGVAEGAIYKNLVNAIWTEIAGITYEATIIYEEEAAVTYKRGATFENDGKYTLTVTAMKTSNGLQSVTTINFVRDSSPLARPVVLGVKEGGHYASATPQWEEKPGFIYKAKLHYLDRDRRTLAYINGTPITEDGRYLLSVDHTEIATAKFSSSSVTFYIDTKAPPEPVIGGVHEGETYMASVQPCWHEPSWNTTTATLSKNGAEPIAYLQGAPISEEGTYILTVVFTGVSGLSSQTSVSFTIKLKTVPPLNLKFDQVYNIYFNRAKLGKVEIMRSESYEMYLPINTLAPELKLNVQNNQDSKEIELSTADKKIILLLDSTEVQGSYSKLYYPPTMYKGTLFIPASALRMLGYEVGSYPSQAYIYIRYNYPETTAITAQSEKLTLRVGETYQLSVIETASSGEAYDVSEIISSATSDQNIVQSLGWGGKIIAQAVGVAIITVNSTDLKKNYRIEVEVIPATIETKKLVYDFLQVEVQPYAEFSARPLNSTADSWIKQLAGGPNKNVLVSYGKLFLLSKQGNTTEESYITITGEKGSVRYLQNSANEKNTTYSEEKQLIDLAIVKTPSASFQSIRLYHDTQGPDVPSRIAFLSRFRGIKGSVVGESQEELYLIDESTLQYFSETKYIEKTLTPLMPEPPKRMKLRIGSTNYQLDDINQTMDVSPLLIQNRTMVPLRYIGEFLGAIFEWDDITKTVFIKMDNKEIILFVNKPQTGMDVPPTIVNSRTMVPVRYISENFGGQVIWDPHANTVEIIR